MNNCTHWLLQKQIWYTGKKNLKNELTYLLLLKFIFFFSLLNNKYIMQFIILLELWQTKLNNIFGVSRIVQCLEEKLQINASGRQKT